MAGDEPIDGGPWPSGDDEEVSIEDVIETMRQLDASVQGLKAEFQRDIDAAERRHAEDLAARDERIDRTDLAIRRSRFMGVAIVGLLVLVAVLGIYANRVAHRADVLANDIVTSRDTGRVNLCLALNDLRVGARAGDTAVAMAGADALISAAQRNTALTPEEQAERQATIDAYRRSVTDAASAATAEALAPQDCSPTALAAFYEHLRQ